MKAENNQLSALQLVNYAILIPVAFVVFLKLTGLSLKVLGISGEPANLIGLLLNF